MSIDTLLGIAMGVMGLRFGEFQALTPAHFDAIYTQWRGRQDALSQERWEIARLTSYYAFVGHSKKKVSSKELIPLPWDKSEVKADRPAEKSTKARFEEIKNRWK